MPTPPKLHKLKTGAEGSKNGMAKHSDEIVREARRLRWVERKCWPQISTALNVPKRTVRDWCHFFNRQSAGGYSEQDKV